MFCQKCGASNDDALKFCVSCGTPLVPVQNAAPAEATTVLNETSAQTPPPYQPPQPVYTPPPAAVPPFQPPAQPAYAPPPPPQKKKGHAGLIIAIVALLLIGVVAVVLLITKPWAKDEDNTTAPRTTYSQTTQQDTTMPGETTAPGETTQEGDTEATTVEDTTWFWGEGTEWPEGGLYAKLPKPNFGKVTFTGTDEADGTATVMLSETTKANFDSYLDALRSAGYTGNVTSGNMFGVYTYTADNAAGEQATASFVESLGTLTIVLDTTP